MRLGVGVGPFYVSGRVGGSRRSNGPAPVTTDKQFLWCLVILAALVGGFFIAGAWPWIAAFFVGIWPVLSVVLIVLGVIIACLVALGIYGMRLNAREAQERDTIES